ncbi:cation:proton antiporter domain-containing protein [Streptomyces sp. NPDC004830]
MSEDEILLGIALTVVLAVGSQILASRLRVPALIVLLPAGFVAGTLTDVVHPDKLVGQDFPALVSLSVALILYDAGLGLDLRLLKGTTRRAVVRLLVFQVLLTWGAVMALGPALLDVPAAVASMLGVILVVSGPTVVGPLLEHVRPSEKVRRVLVWEGSLIDAVGGILGAVVFHSLVSGGLRPGHFRFGVFFGGIAVGLAGGVVGAVLLWLTLRLLRLGETLGTLTQLAVVVLVAAGCDAVYDDTGLIAAIVTGLVAANVPGFEMPARRPFFETLVQLIIGLLFVSISATVTPESLRPVLLPSLVLVAVLIVAVRPVVVTAPRARPLLLGGGPLGGGPRPRPAHRGCRRAHVGGVGTATVPDRGRRGRTGRRGTAGRRHRPGGAAGGRHLRVPADGRRRLQRARLGRPAGQRRRPGPPDRSAARHLGRGRALRPRGDPLRP